MAFVCEACKQRTLDIVLAVRLDEPDDDSDEASAQILRCSACGAGALAIYEESRRGGGESWRHWGWLVDGEVIARAEECLRATPLPSAERFRQMAQVGTSFNITSRAPSA